MGLGRGLIASLLRRIGLGSRKVTIAEWIGPPEEWQVDSVETAIKLAEELHDQGRFDLFRGQRRLWPVRSTLHRKYGDDWQGEGIKDLSRSTHEFLSWARDVKELKSICDDLFQVQAIMQHYGFPTPLIDFTTDPKIAGFFAVDGETCQREDGEKSCIVLASKHDIQVIWKFLMDEHPDLPPIRIVEVGVPDLSRIQTQRGVFMISPLDIESHFPFDRIVFPAMRRTVPIPRRLIYPDQQSALENRVARYMGIRNGIRDYSDIFGPPPENIVHRAAYDQLRAQFDKAKAKAIDELESDERKLGYIPSAFVGGKLADETSWPDADDNLWLSLSNENWADILRAELTLETENAASIPACLSSELETGRLTRDKLINLNYPECDAATTTKTQALWNGMRRLPYSDYQIAQAMKNLIAIIEGGIEWYDIRQQEQLAERLFGRCTRIELGSLDGGYSRAYVPSSVLKEAVRLDIRGLLNPEHLVSSPELLIWRAKFPRKLFRFPEFVNLFALYVIPYQLALGSTTIYYSPLAISIFGLP